MATYRKRGDKWQARVQRNGQPDLAKSFDSRRDAESWARQIEAEIDRGAFRDRTEAERTTLGELIARYLRDVTPDKKSAFSEAKRIDKFLRDEKICQFKASSLTGKLFAEWRDKRLKEVSGSTVNRELGLLSHVINTARKEWGVHIDNPIALIRRPKQNRSRERRLSLQEEAALMEELTTVCRNSWIKPIVIFAIETGMRRGEIISLPWKDVDLQRRVARLIDTKNGEGRSVPLSNRATALLAGLPRSLCGYVFPTTAEALKQL